MCQFQSQLASRIVVFGLGIGAARIWGTSVATAARRRFRKRRVRPSGEQSRTLCVFFELKGGQLLIFPGGTSVIRHATHGVIYASRSYEREHGHWTRITRFDPLLPRLLPRPCLRVLPLISTPSRLCLYLHRIKSFIESEKSNEALVRSTNVYRPRDPWRTRYVNPPGGTRWYPGDYPWNYVQGGPVCSPTFSMAYLLATTVAAESARIALDFLRTEIVTSLEPASRNARIPSSSRVNVRLIS